mgnify:CR=1 FL=1
MEPGARRAAAGGAASLRLARSVFQRGRLPREDKGAAVALRPPNQHVVVCGWSQGREGQQRKLA